MLQFYDDLREKVSLLLAEGHVHAQRYTIATIGIEAGIARRRINNQVITEATLMQACVGTVMGGKEGARHFNKLIKELNRG